MHGPGELITDPSGLVVIDLIPQKDEIAQARQPPLKSAGCKTVTQTHQQVAQDRASSKGCGQSIERLETERAETRIHFQLLIRCSSPPASYICVTNSARIDGTGNKDVDQFDLSCSNRSASSASLYHQASCVSRKLIVGGLHEMVRADRAACSPISSAQFIRCHLSRLDGWPVN